MAKSTRSKSKRAFRRTKRETGVYAAVDAARLHRLSNKLKAKIEADKDGDAPMEEEEVAAEGEGEGPTVVHVYSVTSIQTEEDWIQMSYNVLPFIDASALWRRRFLFAWENADDDMDATNLDSNELRDEWANSVGLEAHGDYEPEFSYEGEMWGYVPHACEQDYWVGHENSDMEHEGAHEGGVEDASGVKYAW